MAGQGHDMVVYARDTAEEACDTPRSSAREQAATQGHDTVERPCEMAGQAL